jgi:hypothetical protein
MFIAGLEDRIFGRIRAAGWISVEAIVALNAARHAEVRKMTTERE